MKRAMTKEKIMEDNKKEVGNDQVEIETEDIAKEQTCDETECDTAECEEEKLSRQDKKKIKKLEADLAEATKELEKAKAVIAEANDKYTRLFAEFDNYRKRTAKEREGIYSDAYADAIGEILPILDNFERALQYKDSQAENENMAKGLEMIQKSFEEALAKMGVSEIEAQGKPFDPELHNAVMHIDDDSYGENEVVEVFMKGYIKGDRVIRHSMVKVAN